MCVQGYATLVADIPLDRSDKLYGFLEQLESVVSTPKGQDILRELQYGKG